MAWTAVLRLAQRLPENKTLAQVSKSGVNSANYSGA